MATSVQSQNLSRGLAREIAYLNDLTKQSVKSSSSLKTTEVVKSWQIAGGKVDLIFNSTKGIYASVEKNGFISDISEEWISGVPKQIQISSEILRKGMENTFLSANQLNDGSWSLRVCYSGKGGMFRPKPWGSMLSAFLGDEAVYKAGAALGYSRLCVAATQGWVKDVEKLLVDGGTDINMVNPDGNTPLDDAIRERNTKIETILREHGALRSNELSTSKESKSKEKDK